ncbi:hypothetical protein DQ244_18675 [Blastococcus sp. TBT05-19]|uniref:GGDEF domain-containing protein n=1 Tax=Blastococcus sp. TBT05-19 TaxID=2250581 RepID=UPI000DEA81D7|nr:diguanylate cyclase [Blastococcus sp. TBT05-19]RBY86701.1 hypothetical protein DQ244_18675 [Blastococcus sp. TBT05-19]
MSAQQWAVVFAGAALIAVLAAALAWRRRDRTPAARALAVTMAGVAAWSAADALLVTVDSDVVRLGYPPVLMAAIGVVVTGIFSVARMLVDPSWRPTRRVLALLAVPHAVTALLAALPATRDLVMVGHGAAGSSAEQPVTFGPVFAVHTLYSYGVVTSAYLRLFRRWRTATGVFRRQIGVLLAAALFSTAGTAMTVVTQLDGHVVDTTPIFFAVTGLVDCWALVRLGFLRLVPVARDQVVDTVPDAVLVVDPHEVLIDLNPAARDMLHRLRPDLGPQSLAGRPLAEIAGERVLEVLARAERRDGHRTVQVNPDLALDVRDTPVADSRGRSLGRILVVRDVSEQQARQQAVESLNRTLAEQLRVIDALRAQLAEEVVRDPLTGLHNRRHLEQVLGDDLGAGSHAGGLAVLAVDIDHFKSINDRFGHGAGDTVLAAVARRLQAAVRDGDTAVRLGGEEFLLVLPDADREQAVRRAEQLRSELAASVHPLDGEDVRVTISVGVAVRPDDGGSASALLKAADRALYTAKATGRNRVVAATGASVDVSEAGEPVPTG